MFIQRRRHRVFVLFTISNASSPNRWCVRVCVQHVCFDSFRFFFHSCSSVLFLCVQHRALKKINGFSMNQLKHIQTIHIMNASYAPMNSELRKKYEISCGEFTNYFFIGARRTLNRVSAWYAHHTEYIWKVSVFVTFDCFVLIFTNYYQLNFHSQRTRNKINDFSSLGGKKRLLFSFRLLSMTFLRFQSYRRLNLNFVRQSKMQSIEMKTPSYTK